MIQVELYGITAALYEDAIFQILGEALVFQIEHQGHDFSFTDFPTGAIAKEIKPLEE